MAVQVLASVKPQWVNTFCCWNRNILHKLGQHYGSWSSGFWCRQVISKHEVASTTVMWNMQDNQIHVFLQENILTTCTILVLRNGRKWTHIIMFLKNELTHWGRVTHISIGNLTIIGSDNGLSPGRRQAIIWTNAGILLIGPKGIHFSGILIEINTFSFNKMHLKMSSAKWRLFRLGLNVLRTQWVNEIRGRPSPQIDVEYTSMWQVWILADW